MSTDVHVQTDPEEQPQRETTSTEQKGSDDGSSALPGTTAETGFVEGDIVTDVSLHLFQSPGLILFGS